MSARLGFGGVRQRGISLLVVMIVVLLSSLLALWAFRSSLVNEAIVGNDADYRRAFEAAQAMLQDAEVDIRGDRADGTACVADTTKPKVCRQGTTLRFIEENKDLGDRLWRLETEAPTTRCLNGICQKRTGAQDFWSVPATLVQMQGAAARYGEYTGAKIPTESLNELLRYDEETGAARAWYWIEIMPYDTSPTGLLADRPKMDLNLNPNVVYRITAVALGTKERTRVVLQSAFVRQKLRN